MIPKPPSPPSARFAYSDKLMSLPRTTRNGLPSSSLTDTSELEHTKVRMQIFYVKARLQYWNCEGNLDVFYFMKISLSLHPSPREPSNWNSDLLQCFEDITLSSTQAPEVACVIIDGAAIAQMLKPGMAKNFGEYDKNVFISFVFSQYKSAH